MEKKKSAKAKAPRPERRYSHGAMATINLDGTDLIGLSETSIKARVQKMEKAILADMGLKHSTRFEIQFESRLAQTAAVAAQNPEVKKFATTMKILATGRETRRLIEKHITGGKALPWMELKGLKPIAKA